MELEKIQDILKDVLAVDKSEVGLDTKFVDDLGADSLDVFQIVLGIEEAFNVEITDEDVEKIVTVGDAVNAIKKARG